ncbi:DUF4070 domain-containing protein [uncultured Thiodictyon sp.]|jgi:hypothetical protein|uniref:DUF4070 domain-containing protein n=1 Tax=uncultured Thiodictyon sp. TaxID=1846217 RepID=UPI0025D3BA59|nr:DUF4070 domain-containing protein [uncultured Thiodictyon sp.]
MLCAHRFSFGTEASLNLAHDAQLLQLVRAAGFSWVFIGIESPDEASLKAANKGQNTGGDILADVHRIYAAGIEVLAGFIVGFDQDTLATFDRQRDFIMASGIQTAMVGLLQALPRTPLYERLERAGRLREVGQDGDNTLSGTNVVPQNMDYDAMVTRYEGLYRELLADTAIAGRIRTKRRHLRNPAYSGSFGVRETLVIVWRLLGRGILPGGPRRWAAFARSLPWLAPTNLAWVLSDWITGLAMADFARRRLAVPLESGAAERCLATVRAAVERYAAAGRAALHVAAGPIPAVSLTLSGVLDRRFFRRTARPLKRLLARTPMTVTLRIEALREAEGRHLERLLRQLRRYGDRVSIVIDERLRQLVQIDTSVFHLVLAA